MSDIEMENLPPQHSLDTPREGGDDPHKKDLTDGPESDALFSMYNEKAEKHDEKMTERWKGDAEGILVFTGLFSAALAQLLVGSLQNLRLSSQDASSFYLARIYQLTPGSNPSSVTLPPDPSQFLTPKSAIWTNTLWSLSLVISLTCALLAILLQQWARRYIRITQKADDPQRRARIREFMFQGSKKRLPLRFMLELLTALLHIAVFLFLAGFIVYLFTFNRFVAMTAAVSAGACTMLYLSISFAPIVFHDSPYYTPLSTLVWIVSNGAIWLGLRLRHSATLRSPSSKPAYTIRQSLHNCYLRITRGITKEVGDLARTQSSFLDTSVISRTFDSIDGDQDMEKFLTCIPGFYRSSDVKKDASALEKFNRKRFPPAIVSFMDRSLSSELLTDTEKWRRIAISFSVINADPQILQGTFQRALQVPESVIFDHLPFVHLSQSRVNDTDPWVRDYARCIVAVAINHIHDYNNDWAVVVREHLGLSECRLAEYWLSGDHHSVRLRNLTHLTRHLMTSRLMESDQFEREGLWHSVFTEIGKLEF